MSLQAMMAGLNQQRNSLGQWRGGAFPDADGAQLESIMAASNPFCGTPRLVLGPDGQQLTLARKLKQQNPEVGSNICYSYICTKECSHTQNHCICSKERQMSGSLLSWAVGCLATPLWETAKTKADTMAAVDGNMLM